MIIRKSFRKTARSFFDSKKVMFSVGLALGGAFEGFRMKWTPFGVNFYDVISRKQLERNTHALKMRLEDTLVEFEHAPSSD